MIIKRSLFNLIKNQLSNEPKVIILYGPRQSGKTTLIKQLVEGIPDTLFLTGDDLRTQDLLSSGNLDLLKKAIGQTKLLVVDEAQRVNNIGVNLKLIFDNKPIHIIASGSSSFDLANQINEPLTGRSSLFTLYPLSLLEVPVIAPDTAIISRLEEFLRFGLYPKTTTLESQTEKEYYLNDLINNYLYKDILSFEMIRKPKKVIDLLTLLALQIGQEVAISELAQNLSLSKTVVEKYLDILEKMFIIINIRGFSRNLRKEISKTSKYYFVDLGLRNALIHNFNSFDIRNDIGGCFENFAIIEKIKALANRRELANFYFWRTYDQKEIDLIEEKNGLLFAWEFKFSAKEKLNKAAIEFTSTYPQSKFKTITPQNLTDFLKN